MAKSDTTGLEPTCIALILCDYVHVDSISDRISILGTIQGMATSVLPAIYLKMHVYAALTDGRGTRTMRVRIIDADEEHTPVWEDSIEVDFTDPHTIQELEFEVLEAQFDKEGAYRLQLFADDAIIMERGLLLEFVEPTEE